MTPEELAERHPKLYHVTTPGAWESIQKLGLRSTSNLLELFDVDDVLRTEVETKRRKNEVPIEHPKYGKVIINDNMPLSEKALSQCLDDHLLPSDWLRILNSRVFFWASEERLNGLLNARFNRNRAREVIIVDTLSLTRAHAQHIDLCPINSGSTIRKPSRRGLSTFTPMIKHSFNDWRKLRGGRDEIQEVTVIGQVLDIADHTLDVLKISPP
jgi:hypothetical protein